MIGFDAIVPTATIVPGDTVTYEGKTYTAETVDRRRRGAPASMGGPYFCTTITWAEGYFSRIEEKIA